MKQHWNIKDNERGYTLLEMIVTLGVLSIFFIGTLGFYAKAYRDLWTRETSMNVLHDANLVMAYIGNDLRQASAYLKNYKHQELQTVVAAMKILKGAPEHPEESTIMYALDQNRPHRLIRAVDQAGNLISMELSTSIQTLDIKQIAAGLFEVQVVVSDQIAGRTITRQFSSAYSMRK